MKKHDVKSFRKIHKIVEEYFNETSRSVYISFAGIVSIRKVHLKSEYEVIVGYNDCTMYEHGCEYHTLTLIIPQET